MVADIAKDHDLSHYILYVSLHHLLRRGAASNSTCQSAVFHILFGILRAGASPWSNTRSSGAAPHEALHPLCRRGPPRSDDDSRHFARHGMAPKTSPATDPEAQASGGLC